MNLFSYLTDPANWQGPDGIWHLLLEHLGYTVAAVGIAAAIAIPLGIFIGHTGRGAFLVIGLSNAARAIPTLGLLVLVVLLLGTGKGPIIGVLALVLCIGPYLFWVWRPGHQVRLHTEHFFHAIDGRNWEVHGRRLSRSVGPGSGAGS